MAIKAKHLIPLSLGLLAASHAFNAVADISDFDALDDPSTAKKPFDGQAQLGYTGRSGNSHSSSLNAGVHGTWFKERTAYSAWATANSASDSEKTTAEKYQLGGRTRYNMDERNYLFGQLRWQSDRFAGYRSRTTLAAGYGRQVWTGSPHTLSYEIGPGVRHDDYKEGGSDTRMIAYGSLNYAYQISDTARFTQRLGVQYASNNTTTNSESALNVDLNKDFTLRVAYSVEHNSNPPKSAEHRTDTTTTLSLVYGL